MKVVVEHLEECLSPWLMCEYSYVVKLFKNSVLFTNVKSLRTRNTLKELGVDVVEASVVDLVANNSLRHPIILDPKARETLTPEDLVSADSVIIGGIMGEHPPKGRTFREITSKLISKAKIRNLGKLQLTIAGTAYVLKRMLEGTRLESLDIRFGLRFVVQIGEYEVTIELPYAFPYEEGRVVLPESYLEVIARRSLIYESKPTCL
ncbi:MAG: SAM-dependent methyltransferase [Sulfolobales archaeon]